MKGKTWIIAFLLIVAIGSGAYMCVCYQANPLGYFTTDKGLDYYFTDDYARAMKAKYVAAHKNDFDGFILGGSKAGALDVERIEEYSGLKYYNLFLNVGNFSDYLAFTRFLVEQTSAKEIMLQLSSFETVAYTRDYLGTNMQIPAVVEGNWWDRATEHLGFLMANFDTVIDAFRNNRTRDLRTGNPISTGMRNRRGVTLRYLKDPEAQARRERKRLNHELELLFAEDASWEYPTYEQNLNALREMKALCDEHGVALKCLVGASFIGERYRYECSGYYNYLADVVDIVGEVWDFSSYHPINLNVYNFYLSTVSQ